MTTVILLRHGRSTANVSGVLAGRSTGVGLDDHGRAQAEKLVDRLAELPLAAVVTSPLQRCQETVAPLLAARGLEATVEDDLSEVDYGDWTGRKLGELGKEDLWKVVQAHPSAAVFPGGEGLAAMQARAVAAIRRQAARIGAEHGDRALWVACSHGDVIKAAVADALGLHLDSFQRIVGRPLLGERHQLHPDTALRRAGQRHRRRPVRAGPEAGERGIRCGRRPHRGRLGRPPVRDRRARGGHRRRVDRSSMSAAVDARDPHLLQRRPSVSPTIEKPCPG